MLICEDHHLIELEVIKKIDQLLDLLVLIQLHEVLLQSMQVQFGVIVNVELEWVLHEHLAHFFGIS